jgi:AcrR family transcriptional regulator
VQAADIVFTKSGMDVSLEEISRHAGVGIATLYRHFATKTDLVRAVVEQAFEDQVEPALQRALDGEVEPLAGLAEVLEAALTMAFGHRNALAAVKGAGRLASNLAPSFFERLATVLARAQQQGTVRGDLQPGDLPRLVSMLVTSLWFDETGEGWRRYLGLMLDSLKPQGATPLPPLAARPGFPGDGGQSLVPAAVGRMVHREVSTECGD